MRVWSPVRREPFFTPMVTTSLKLAAYAGLSSAAHGRGKADWNWALLASTNGAVNEMFAGAMLVPVADSHWPIAAPAPLNGATGLLKPSRARQDRICLATLSPQSSPRLTVAESSALKRARDAARCWSKRVSWSGKKLFRVE